MGYFFFDPGHCPHQHLHLYHPILRSHTNLIPARPCRTGDLSGTQSRREGLITDRIILEESLTMTRVAAAARMGAGRRRARKGEKGRETGICLSYEANRSLPCWKTRDGGFEHLLHHPCPYPRPSCRFLHPHSRLNRDSASTRKL